jgi:hypothetical protein
MKEQKILLSKDRTYLTGNRAEDVFISRIRIGHTRLTHGHEATSRASATFVRKLWANVDSKTSTCRMDQIRWTQSEVAKRPGTILRKINVKHFSR